MLLIIRLKPEWSGFWVANLLKCAWFCCPKIKVVFILGENEKFVFFIKEKWKKGKMKKFCFFFI